MFFFHVLKTIKKRFKTDKTALKHVSVISKKNPTMPKVCLVQKGDVAYFEKNFPESCVKRIRLTKSQIKLLLFQVIHAHGEGMMGDLSLP